MSWECYHRVIKKSPFPHLYGSNHLRHLDILLFIGFIFVLLHIINFQTILELSLTPNYYSNTSTYLYWNEDISFDKYHYFNKMILQPRGKIVLRRWKAATGNVEHVCERNDVTFRFKLCVLVLRHVFMEIIDCLYPTCFHTGFTTQN